MRGETPSALAVRIRVRDAPPRCRVLHAVSDDSHRTARERARTSEHTRACDTARAGDTTYTRTEHRSRRRGIPPRRLERPPRMAR